MRKTAVNGRIHVFHKLTEQQLKVKHWKMCFYEFSRIHYRGKTLENACFRLDNSCEHFIHQAKSGCEQKKTAFSMHYTNCKLWKTFCFPAFTLINLPGKCVFSAVYSDEYVVHLENVNKQKENTLFAVR